MIEPFWKRCTAVELQYRIQRLERALPYCRGRAADIRPHVEEHIRFLKGVFQKRMRLAAAAKLETVLLRFHLELPAQYHWRIKSAIGWLRKPPR
jgi:hypothetical protein